MARLSFPAPLLLDLIYGAAQAAGIEADDPSHDRDMVMLAALLRPAVDATLAAITAVAPITEVDCDADLQQHILRISATALPAAAPELEALPHHTRQAVLNTFVEALSSRQPPKKPAAWLCSVAKRAGHEPLRVQHATARPSTNNSSDRNHVRAVIRLQRKRTRLARQDEIVTALNTMHQGLAAHAHPVARAAYVQFLLNATEA